MTVKRQNGLQGNGFSDHALGRELLRTYEDHLRTFRKEYLASGAAPRRRDFNAEQFASGVLFLQSGWHTIFDETSQYSGLPDQEPYEGLMLRVTVLGDALTELFSYAEAHGLWTRQP